MLSRHPCRHSVFLLACHGIGAPSAERQERRPLASLRDDVNEFENIRRPRPKPLLPKLLDRGADVVEDVGLKIANYL